VTIYEHNLCCYAEEKLLKKEKKTWEVRAAVGLVAPSNWPRAHLVLREEVRGGVYMCDGSQIVHMEGRHHVR
jgi:hypothetical protein